MKIAYLINQYPRVSHSFVRREILALEALGHEVVRFSVRPCPDQLQDDLDLAEAPRTTVILRQPAALLIGLLIMATTRLPRFLSAVRLGWRLWRRSDRSVVQHLAYLIEACYLARRLQTLRCQHLHAHFGTNSTDVAMLCRVLGGPAYSFTVHGPEEFDRPQALSLDVKIANAKFVAAISNYGKSQLQRWCDFAHWNNIHVVHCALDEKLFADVSDDWPTVPRMVCIGRLVEQKGHLTLIEAAERLSQQGRVFEIVLIGDGPFRSLIESEIAARGLQAHILLIGWQSEKQILTWLAQSRGLVLSSFAEGLPVVLMESYARRRPVVSTYVAGIPELVEHRQSGWLAPASDAAGLAEAIGELLDASPETLAAFADRGRQVVLRNHASATEAAKLAAYFEA
ncbi:MAG: glycosyltransferase [Planctomycetales bacterium]|nr:glycosyltransferase [Planctomycetales bacterium]